MTESNLPELYDLTDDQLLAEACLVLAETGLTPRQLAEQLTQARNVAKDFQRLLYEAHNRKLDAERMMLLNPLPWEGAANV